MGLDLHGFAITSWWNEFACAWFSTRWHKCLLVIPHIWH